MGFGVSLKSPTFRGGGSRKTNIEGGGGLLKKEEGGLDSADLRGELGKKEGVTFFEGRVNTPMRTICLVCEYSS